MFKVQQKTIDQGLLDLMKGAKNTESKTISDFMLKDTYIAFNPQYYENVQKVLEKINFGALINEAWKFDRPYILHVDAPNGCKSDHRGAPEYRICLDKHPNKSFWLYAITHDEDEDFLDNDESLIRGPTRYRGFLTPSATNLGITLEEIVRSSLYVHEKGLNVRGGNQTIDANGPSEILKNQGTISSIPSVFTIPIYRNPFGEAISAVWAEDGRNYPCICGEFSWKDPKYDFYKNDQTPKFLMLSQLAFSEDQEHYCRSHNYCITEENIDLFKYMDRLRHKNDPPITTDMKHQWYRCNGVGDHKYKGHPEKDNVEGISFLASIGNMAANVTSPAATLIS